MTQPQTVQVEKEELLARADELEAQIPSPPTENPQAPCALAMAIKASQDLGLSADNMRLYLGVGERERRRLAESLRNAAKAYEDTDKEAADAVDTEGGSVSPVTPAPVDEDLDLAALNDTRGPATGPDDEAPYYECRQAAQELVEADQGASFDRYADAWAAYQRTLQEATYRFRPFQQWDGDSRIAVEAHFDSQRGWMYAMAGLCGQLAQKAQGVTTAQKWAVSQHPTVEAIQELDDAWERFYGTEYWLVAKQQVLDRFAEYQTMSEEVLAEYTQRATLPLGTVNPPMPPAAYRIDPPPTGDGSEADGLGGLPTGDGLPSMPQLPTGTPPAGGFPWSPKPDAALTDAAAKAPKLPKGPSGLKPASFGGGAGLGVLPAPLQPAAEAEAAPRPIAGPRDPAGPGRVNPPMGGAMGAGGGMGMPMSHPGQGQEGGKGKQVRQDEQSLYTETRPWTSGVIGNRGAKAPVTTADGQNMPAAS